MTWISARASALAVLAILAGCGKAPPQTGIVSSVLGKVLVAAIERPEVSSCVSSSSLALVAEVKIVESDHWKHLLAADGCSGWTRDELGASAPVKVRSAMPNNRWLAKSPDEVTPEASDEAAIGSDDIGEISGTSMRTLAPSREMARIPERLRATRWPWIRAKFGSNTGYSPLDQTELVWTPAEDLKHLQGWVRRPFLGPYSRALSAMGMGGIWTVPELYYRDPKNPERSLILYASGKDRLMLFFDGGKVIARHLAPADRITPRRIEFLDASGTNSATWLVESNGIYGDGVYSTLWQVQSSTGTVEELRLSSSSGENTEDVEADWWVQSGNVWIAYRNAQKSWIAKPGKDLLKGAWVVSAAGGSDYEMVRRIADKRIAGVVPGSLNPVRWDSALAFESEEAAKKASAAWAGSNIAWSPGPTPVSR